MENKPKFCFICGLALKKLYPGGDPENGPASFRCPSQVHMTVEEVKQQWFAQMSIEETIANLVSSVEEDAYMMCIGANQSSRRGIEVSCEALTEIGKLLSHFTKQASEEYRAATDKQYAHLAEHEGLFEEDANELREPESSYEEHQCQETPCFECGEKEDACDNCQEVAGRGCKKEQFLNDPVTKAYGASEAVDKIKCDCRYCSCSDDSTGLVEPRASGTSSQGMRLRLPRSH